MCQCTKIPLCKTEIEKKSSFLHMCTCNLHMCTCKRTCAVHVDTCAHVSTFLYMGILTSPCLEERLATQQYEELVCRAGSHLYNCLRRLGLSAGITFPFLF